MFGAGRIISFAKEFCFVALELEGILICDSVAGSSMPSVTYSGMLELGAI